MADKTGIEWADATWTPIVGCSIVSPGCTNCYAMQMAARIEAMALAETGNPPRPQKPSHYAGTTKPSKAGPVWTGKLALAPDHILTQPLRWKKPRTIFVNSMGDLLHEDTPDEWIDKVFAIMALAHWHTFLVLTKRAARMQRYLTAGRGFKWIDAMRPYAGWPEGQGGMVQTMNGALENVWLGVSTERQAEADERIPLLLATPAAKRFISAEPLLGSINLRRIACEPDGDWRITVNALTGKIYRSQGDDLDTILDGKGTGTIEMMPFGEDAPGLDWVIAGGESGKGARPMHPDWPRGLRDQCAAAGVPFFFKQWGEWAPHTREIENAEGEIATSPRGGINWHSFDGGISGVWRVGKARAGRLLDGVEYSERPQP